MDHPAKEQWVFGGVERHSGKTFLVTVPDRSAGTLMAVVEAWIEPGIRVNSDCCSAYRHLGAQGYTHHSVSHSTCFVDRLGGAHTNTIESTLAPCEGIPEPLKQEGRLYIPPSSVHVLGEVQGLGRIRLYEVHHSSRRHKPLERLPPPKPTGIWRHLTYSWSTTIVYGVPEHR